MQTHRADCRLLNSYHLKDVDRQQEHMKMAVFGKSLISENKCILKITTFIPNTRITRKALISGYDSFFIFTNPYGKYLEVFRPHSGPGVDSASNK